MIRASQRKVPRGRRVEDANGGADLGGENEKIVRPLSGRERFHSLRQLSNRPGSKSEE
jgi:hypothetical protein